MRISAGIILLAALLASAAPAAPPSAADFAAAPTASQPRLSADGRWLATRATSGDTTRLLIIDVEKPAGRPRAIDLGKVNVSNVQWAGSKRLLLTVRGTDTVFGMLLPFTRLLIVDVATGEARLGDPANRGMLGGEVLHTDLEGDSALVVSQDSIYQTPAVKRIDLATGKAVIVERPKPEVWDWYADEQGTVRAGLAHDERAWKLYYRDKAGEPLRIVKGKFARDNDATVERFTFGQGGTGSVITNERTGRFGLYRYDFNTGTIGEPMFEHPEVDIDYAWGDRWSGEVKGLQFESDRTRFHWFDSELQKVQARLDRALPSNVNEIVARSRVGDRILIHSRSASDPGTWFILDQKTRRMSPVLSPFDRIDPAAMSPTTSLSYTARDGLRIPAYLTLPRERGTRQLPLIVLPHGGPFVRDSWEYDVFVQFLASRGYAVFQPQFRGSTGYGKSFVERGYGQWGRAMQDDLDDGLDHLAREGTIDPRRVCIVGASYGGYAALWGAIRNPERYRCAASLAGVTDLDAQLKANRRSFSATRYFRSWRTKVAGEQKIDLRTVSPLAQADRLKVPVLIAHGEKDATVDVKQGRMMVDALQRRRADVTSVFYPKSGHDLEGDGDLADYLQRLEQFLRKHNPA